MLSACFYRKLSDTPMREAVDASPALVNFKYSFIFNGVFEVRESTQYEKRFAKMLVIRA
jgi:hypothetical protein